MNDAPPATVALPSFDAVAQVVRSRRTNLRIDPDRSVDSDRIAQLCELATWAPNHKLTQPWRFAVLTGGARAALGEAGAAAMLQRGETDEGRVAKVRSKYLRAPVILAVASAHTDADTDERRAEDRDAVAAGIQNLLLAATACGLASYWGSGGIMKEPAVKDLCGLSSSDELVALLYLGWPIGEVPVPARNPPAIIWKS